MLKYCIYIRVTEALKSLREDATGVVSFEYVIVAACIIATVGAAFGAGAGGTAPVKDALIGALGTITTKVASAVGS